MPFSQTKRTKNMTKKMLGFLLALLIIVGCVAQKTEKAQTAEQLQTKPEASDKSPDIKIDRQITSVSVGSQDQIVEIKIKGNQKLVYTSIKQAFPFGIAIYLPETKIADDFQTELTENKSISDLTVTYADMEMTTVKVEILLKENLDYEVAEKDSILTLSLFGVMENNQAKENDTKPLPVMADEKSQESTDLQEPVMIPAEPATLTNIEFNTMEDGKSDIVVQTNHPVKYDITSGGKNKLYLNLYNTMIPDYHKRPLLTQYFKSAVESLMPVEVPGKKKDSKIEITIRDQVPYRIVSNQNTISLFFEPSMIEPPVFSKAKKDVISGTQVQETELQEEEKDLPEKTAAVAEKKLTMEEEIFGLPKKYTGEKIKLDFYETDIKNVFRILRSVGGLNFAIDKNVEGKVTLTLEDPVPWDQVMDLVLKMNNLGQKKEGNVIRIATLDTLRNEEKLFQDTLSERKKSLEQKKSFEPLITEYIPINYSDAEADIKPHIDQILTKERGKLTVDKRTNMIIVTDTQAKIDQAREIIYRLDRVTPQIMIEAKVVEVTKEFSRELGLGLNFARSRTANTGPATDYSIGLNYPAAAPQNSGAFNFYSILGSDYLSLKATLAADESKGNVKVVSSPRILTLDNKKAKIKQGLEYAYLERDDTGGSSVKFKNIDLLLEVTPHVTPDKRIAMTVYLTKNDIDSVTNGVPSLSTNEAETELLVNNNDTIVIGGIVKTSDNKSSSGMPYLSGIPVLGRLFRTDVDKDKRNELLIFITPSIVQLEQKRNTFTTAD